MGFKIFMLIVVYFIPLTMLSLAGYFSGEHRKKPLCIRIPNKRSMRNEETWSSRINILGKYGIFCGLLSAPLSVIAMAIVFGKGTETMGVLRWLWLSRWFRQPFSWREIPDRDCIEEKTWWKRENEVYPSPESSNPLYFLIKDHEIIRRT